MELGGVEITNVIAIADADAAALPRNPVQPASERVSAQGRGKDWLHSSADEGSEGCTVAPRLPRPGSARQAVPTRV